MLSFLWTGLTLYEIFSNKTDFDVRNRVEENLINQFGLKLSKMHQTQNLIIYNQRKYHQRQVESLRLNLASPSKDTRKKLLNETKMRAWQLKILILNKLCGERPNKKKLYDKEKNMNTFVPYTQTKGLINLEFSFIYLFMFHCLLLLFCLF